MNLIRAILITNGVLILVSVLIFTYYSVLSLRFKRGGSSRTIMVLGSFIYLLPAFFANYLLWSANIINTRWWILFALSSLGIITVAIGGLTSWKNIQKLYDVPLIEMAQQIIEVRHQIISILLLLISIPTGLYIAIFQVDYFSISTVVHKVFLSLGFIFLAINSRVEYRSIEKVGEFNREKTNLGIRKGKLSTLKEDLALTYAFTYLVNSFLTSVTPILGKKVMRKTLLSWEEEHPILFQDFVKNDKCRISKKQLVENLSRIYEDDRLAIITDEYKSLLSFLVDLMGKVTNYSSANRILSDSYEKMEQNYGNHPVVLKILRMIPGGLLEDKKLGLLTKEELEEEVRERTLELQKSNIKLKDEIEERKRAEKRLKKSLQEKNILLKEIHHRVKNNLQVISSLLNLQARKIEDKDARDAFLESCDRIRTMASIHNQLYRYENLAKINFEKYIKDLTSYLFRSYRMQNREIKMDIQVDKDIYLEIDKAIPCGLIINELLTNALKYAFSEQETGNIKIKMGWKDDSNLELIVMDNGIGLDKDFSLEDTKTLGTRLVKRLVDQLEGEISFDNGNGARFFITFPVELDSQ